jgi:hypothetical protein
MSTIQITESDILAELARLGTAPSDAMTIMELVDATGFSRGKVQQDLGKLHRAGRILVHRVKRQRLDGQMTTVPAYTVTKGKKR